MPIQNEYRPSDFEQLAYYSTLRHPFNLSVSTLINTDDVPRILSNRRLLLNTLALFVSIRKTHRPITMDSYLNTDYNYDVLKKHRKWFDILKPCITILNNKTDHTLLYDERTSITEFIATLNEMIDYLIENGDKFSAVTEDDLCRFIREHTISKQKRISSLYNEDDLNSVIDYRIKCVHQYVDILSPLLSSEQKFREVFLCEDEDIVCPVTNITTPL